MQPCLGPDLYCDRVNRDCRRCRASESHANCPSQSDLGARWFCAMSYCSCVLRSLSLDCTSKSRLTLVSTCGPGALHPSRCWLVREATSAQDHRPRAGADQPQQAPRSVGREAGPRSNPPARQGLRSPLKGRYLAPSASQSIQLGTISSSTSRVSEDFRKFEPVGPCFACCCFDELSALNAGALSSDDHTTQWRQASQSACRWLQQLAEGKHASHSSRPSLPHSRRQGGPLLSPRAVSRRVTYV